MTDLANLRSLGLSIELTGPFRPAPELLFTYVREVCYNYREKRRQVFVFLNHLNRIFVWNCHSDMLTKCVLLVLLTAIAAVDVSLGSLVDKLSFLLFSDATFTFFNAYTYENGQVISYLFLSPNLLVG